jgi:hypothetical protein
MDFARGHFLDVEAIKEHLKSLSEVMDSSSVEAGQE